MNFYLRGKNVILRVIVVPKPFSKRIVVDFQLRNLLGGKDAKGVCEKFSSVQHRWE